MTDLVPFSFESHDVRVVMRDGQPWWVLADVCEVLELTNARNPAARLDEDEKGVHTMDTLGGPQEVTVINESGLYSLIFTSRKAAAKRFKKWVTSEVLPQIRKTGGYRADQVSYAPPPWTLENWRERLAMVQETRKIFGEPDALWMWEQMGFPEPPQWGAEIEQIQRMTEGMTREQAIANHFRPQPIQAPPDVVQERVTITRSVKKRR
ncbi:MAG: Bro-N domain-containing protein [Gluconobacter cerinus]|uniref:BRO-N domain-containing protein n=1 Tax=Gluconobacter cerinus TaxID=38307 RepID=UPI0039ED98CE